MKYVKKVAFWLTYVVVFAAGGLSFEYHTDAYYKPVDDGAHEERLQAHLQKQLGFSEAAYSGTHDLWMECQVTTRDLSTLKDNQYKIIKALRSTLKKKPVDRCPPGTTECSKALQRCAGDLAWHERMLNVKRAALPGSTQAWTTVLGMAVGKLKKCEVKLELFRARFTRFILGAVSHPTPEERCKTWQQLCADCKAETGASCASYGDPNDICKMSYKRCVRAECKSIGGCKP